MKKFIWLFAAFVLLSPVTGMSSEIPSNSSVVPESSSKNPALDVAEGGKCSVTCSDKSSANKTCAKKGENCDCYCAWIFGMRRLEDEDSNEGCISRRTEPGYGIIL